MLKGRILCFYMRDPHGRSGHRSPWQYLFADSNNGSILFSDWKYLSLLLARVRAPEDLVRMQAA
jgi:hypothetical protein